MIPFNWWNRRKEQIIDLKYVNDGDDDDDDDDDVENDDDDRDNNLQMRLHQREWLTTVLVWTQLFKLFAAQKGCLKVKVAWKWKLTGESYDVNVAW